MSRVAVSIDAGPPLGIPLRFHLTAPWFGVAAALLLLADGDAAWSSRWTTSMLGVTHLLTLGFLAMVMTGSLYQVMPVLTGRMIPGTERIAPVVHIALTAGALCLAIALRWMIGWLFWPALALLAVWVLGLLVPLAVRLATKIGGDSVFAIRLAALSLLITVATGSFMAVGHAVPESGIPIRLWTDAHAGWGLAGWVALLVMGVSFQVIPMFHVAPGFPKWLSRGAPLLTCLALTLLALASAPRLQLVGMTALALGLIGYAACALGVLARRKRRLPDATVRFWQLALSSLIIATSYAWLRLAAPGVRIPWLPLGADDFAIGALLLLGFGVSVILGMLQKIAPFLIFMHLQRACLKKPQAIPHLPPMTVIVPPGRAMWQLRIHAAALLTTLAALAWPAVGPWAAAVLALDFAWLARSLLMATACHRAAASRITAE